MKRTKSYKLICRIAIWGLVCGFLGVNISQAAAATTNKQLLAQADFKYVGAFEIPSSLPSGFDLAWGKALTHRYVNGELRMFSSAWNRNGPESVYEVKPPTASLTAPYPRATLVREWGDIWQGKRYTADGGSEVIGLYWDETDKRLYWSYGSMYNTLGWDDPSVGYSTLNDSTGAGTAVGAWRFTGRGPKATLGCVIPLPQWFADAYTGGRRLAAGCGGPQSAITVGPAHMGPALTSFSPPNISSNPNQSSLSFVNLVGYPFTQNTYGPPDRAHRDLNYSVDDPSSWLAWPPQNGIGYWTDEDTLFQSGTWIDLPDKHGVIFFPILGNGRIWYESSQPWAQSGSHWWYVYDPADLSRVALGQKQEWEIQAAVKWSVQYPGLTYPLEGWGGLPWYLISGVTFDQTKGRLYVAVRFAGDGGHRIYVYEVQSGSGDTTPPATPSGLRVR